MFQSLFSWMTLIGRLCMSAEGSGTNEFQSLFSWMTLIGRRPVDASGEQCDVSILVFLDDAHRPVVARDRSATVFCFNPCFLG